MGVRDKEQIVSNEDDDGTVIGKVGEKSMGAKERSVGSYRGNHNNRTLKESRAGALATLLACPDWAHNGNNWTDAGHRPNGVKNSPIYAQRD